MPTAASRLDQPESADVMLVLLSGLAFISVVLVPLWDITLAFAPLPVYLATKVRGPSAGGLLLLGITGAAVLVVGVSAAVAGLVMAALGLAPALRAPAIKPEARIALAATVVFLILSGTILAQFAVEPRKTAAAVSEQSDQVHDWLIKQMGPAGRAPELRAQVKDLSVMAPYLLFGVLGLISIWLATLNYVLTGRLARRWGLAWASMPPLRDWTLPWPASYGFIVGLAGFLFSEQFGGYRLVVLAVGFDFLMVFGALYFFQGAAVLKFYLDKGAYGPGTKFVVIIFGLLAQVVFQGLTWLGLFDTWLDFRRLATSK